MKIVVKHNFPEVQRALTELRKDIAERAAASAVNKTMAQAKTSMSKEIRSEFTVPAAKVNAALRVSKASFRNGLYRIEATLESPAKRGRSLNVINFQARQTSRGVSVKIKKGGPRKVIRSAFIANQGRTVFERVGKSRLPIKAVQTIDIAQMFNTRRINARVVKFIETKFPAVFAHEASFFLTKFNRGGA